MIALTLVLVVGAAGCGGGKKKSETTTTTTTTAAAPATTQKAKTTAAAATTPATPTTTSSSSALGALGSLQNCKQLSDLGTAFASALQGANGDVQKEKDLFNEFAAKTPSDIRPDFETIAQAFSKIADALKGVNLASGKTPDAATLAKLTQLEQQFNTPAFQKATTDIQNWAAKNCKS
jgi:hypothetical protein